MSNTTNEQDRKEFSFEENFIDETIIADKSSKTKEFIKKFMKRKTAVAGFIVIVFLVFLAIFGQYLAPYDPDAYDYSNMLAGPSAAIFLEPTLRPRYLKPSSRRNPPDLRRFPLLRSCGCSPRNRPRTSGRLLRRHH